ncbi:MAG: methionyl-tRNA formyltransferase [Betaproteobacteria bacterium]|uniref:Methionyl-tRNA formyltransferase n=1 Tax=Candidatus Proximibacter danicus TaxID=2954365 RepID=A0A9D7K6N0_9PROT|nr:methionyl-tRNA formyltransferase [Candidatus Proximibacter danicus]
MKVIFAGTPEFAAVALAAILDAGHDVALVLTQPDRPAGRGMALQASAVKRLASARGIPVFQPSSLKDVAAQGVVRAVDADLMVVAAYGLILPQSVLDMPRLGCLNIHASLLPRWRGAAPIQRAILAGDAETGVCIMQMEAGLDTGPVLLSEAIPIGSADTAATLHDALAGLGGRLIVATLARLPLPAVIQPDSGVTYAAKIDKAESAIDWARPAVEVDRHIRAFNPFPGASARLDGGVIKIWRAALVPGQGSPGEVLSVDRDGIVVACGDQALRVSELQKAGGKRLSAAEFLAGNGLEPGARFVLAA